MDKVRKIRILVRVDREVVRKGHGKSPGDEGCQVVVKWRLVNLNPVPTEAGWDDRMDVFSRVHGFYVAKMFRFVGTFECGRQYHVGNQKENMKRQDKGE
jgi:hypothetical protein